MGQMLKLQDVLAAMVPGGVKGIPNLYWPAIADAAKFGGAVCEGYSKCGVEWAAFLGRRLERQAQLGAELASCRSPSELGDIYAKFATVAAKDYGDEMGRLTELSTGIYRDASTAIGQRPSSQKS